MVDEGGTVRGPGLARQALWAGGRDRLSHHSGEELPLQHLGERPQQTAWAAREPALL